METDFSDLLGVETSAPTPAPATVEGTRQELVQNPRPWANTRGRPPGSTNRLTTKMREALMRVYDKLGGDDGFAAWANNHKTEFYKLIVKAVPKESELHNRAAGITVNVIGAADLRRGRGRPPKHGEVIDVKAEPVK